MLQYKRCKMKKIAILNDIHGNLYLLNKALDYLKKENISLYLICGDFLTDGPDDNQIIDTLKSLPCEVILGNREESILSISKEISNLNEKMNPIYYTYLNLTRENLGYLKSLSSVKQIMIDNYKIYMSHGSPYKNTEKVDESSHELFKKLISDYQSDVYLFAHTHKNFNITYQNKLFINSGAINCFKGQKSVSTFGILTINDLLTTYEQIELPINFEDVKNYYYKSNYYKAFPEWTNIILYIIKYGVNYNSIFSKEYNSNISLKENYNNFIKNHNLPGIYK